MAFNAFYDDNLVRLHLYDELHEDPIKAERRIKNKRRGEEDSDSEDEKYGQSKYRLKHPDIEDFDLRGDDYIGEERRYLEQIGKHRTQLAHKLYMHDYYKNKYEMDQRVRNKGKDRLLDEWKRRDEQRRARKRKRKQQQIEEKKQQAAKAREPEFPASIQLPDKLETERARQERDKRILSEKQNINNTWEDLAVESVDTKDDSVPFFKDGLPAPPFRWLLIAQSMSGKTTLIMNMLKPKMYGDYFAEFRVFSKSIEDDPKWELLSPKQKEWCKKDFNDDEIQQIWDEQEVKVKADGGKTRENSMLIIIDDSISSLYNRNGKPRVTQKLFMRGRHANISVVVTAQQYMLTPGTMRINSSALVIFEIHNIKEQENVYVEHGGSFSRKEWKALTKHVWNHPFSFLFIDYTKPREERYKRNFQYVLQIENPEDKPDAEF